MKSDKSFYDMTSEERHYLTAKTVFKERYRPLLLFYLVVLSGILVGMFSLRCIEQLQLDTCSLQISASSKSIKVENRSNRYLVIFEYEYEGELYHGHYYSDTVAPSSIEIKICPGLPSKYEI